MAMDVDPTACHRDEDDGIRFETCEYDQSKFVFSGTAMVYPFSQIHVNGIEVRVSHSCWLWRIAGGPNRILRHDKGQIR